MMVCIACCGGGGAAAVVHGGLTTTKGTSQTADLSRPIDSCPPSTHILAVPSSRISDRGLLAARHVVILSHVVMKAAGASRVDVLQVGKDKRSVATQLLWSSHRNPGQDLPTRPGLWLQDNQFGRAFPCGHHVRPEKKYVLKLSSLKHDGRVNVVVVVVTCPCGQAAAALSSLLSVNHGLNCPHTKSWSPSVNNGREPLIISSQFFDAC